MTKKDRAKRVKIETLYSDKESLKRFGNKLRGKCPFHKDSTNPNFFIYLDTNTWFCFAGCGGGDVISFVQKRDNITFPEALEVLA